VPTWWLRGFGLLRRRTRSLRSSETRRDPTSPLGVRHQTISFFRRFSLRQVEQQLHQHNQEMARRLESVEPQMQQHFLELQDMHEKFTVQQLVASSRASGP
jgi:hypothetical protein